MDGNNNIEAPPEDETNKDVICIDDEAENEGALLNHAQAPPRTGGRRWVMDKRSDAQHLDELSNDPDGTNDNDRGGCDLRCRKRYPDDPAQHPTTQQKDGFEDNDQDPTNRGVT